jgi:hypothetical protein
VPVAVLEAMHVMLPEHAEVLTPYGATECLPVTVIDSRTLLQETRMLTDAGTCHGSPGDGCMCSAGMGHAPGIAQCFTVQRKLLRSPEACCMPLHCCSTSHIH